MKVTQVKTTIVNIPFKKPYTWRLAERSGESMVIVQVYTDEGIVGLGETRSPNVSIAKVIIDNAIRDIVIGEDPFNIEKIIKKFYEGSGALWYQNAATWAMSGVETALFDIIGKSLGVPLYKLLGGKFSEKIPCCADLGMGKPDNLAHEATKLVEQGFTTLKLRVGLPLSSPSQDIEMIKAVREAVGHSIELRIDANQAWTPGTAIRQINKLEKYDLQYVEQPVPAWDLNGMARVRRAVSTPIAAHESVYTASDALRVIEKEAADIISVCIFSSGGIIECKKLCSICEAAGIPVVMHTAVEGGIGTAARLHVIASTPVFLYANDTHYHNLTGDVLKEPLNVEKGHIKVPEKPGLGIELDEKKLAKYASYKPYKAFQPEIFPRVPCW